MTKRNKQLMFLNFALNLLTLKELLKQSNLCDKDCDCGCKDSATELCDKGCSNCGCKDATIELCDKDCDCGCKDATIEFCDKDCDCGCKDSATELCDKGCSNCGCKDATIELCDKDCDCGCVDTSCKTNGNLSSAEEGNCESRISSGDDDDGGDDDCKNDKCHCGCGHHHNHHNHNSEHHGNCHCQNKDLHKTCDGNSEQADGKNLAEEYLNLARQVQADFDNYRRRNVDAIKQAKTDGIKETVIKFLPSLDVVDRAMQYMHDDDSKQGLTLIRKMFEKIFGELKIEPIVCVGTHYNPEFHDVVISEESEYPSGTIIEEIETGYTLDGKVIKHSVVKIAK